jgi:hypothetical protein
MLNHFGSNLMDLVKMMKGYYLKLKEALKKAK